MRSLFIAMITVMIVFIPLGSINADQHSGQQKWEELNHTADQVLQLTKEDKYEEAKQLLNYFSKQFLNIQQAESKLTMSQLRIITTSYEKAMGAITSVSKEPKERVEAVLEFRLAVDALVSDHNPLWKNTKKSLLTTFSTMKEAADNKDYQEFQHRLNELMLKYQTIRPAIMIYLEPQYFERVDSHFRFLEKYRAVFVEDIQKVKHLELMEKDLDSLYEGFSKDSTDPSLWWVISSIGGMICISLMYVGWKKYKAEKNKVKVKE